LKVNATATLLPSMVILVIDEVIANKSVSVLSLGYPTWL